MKMRRFKVNSTELTADRKLVELLEKQKKDLIIRILRQHEEAQSEKVFSNMLLANLSDLFFVMTKDFALVKANDEFRRLMGFSPEDFEQLHLDAIMDHASCERIKELIAGGEFKNFETELITQGGERLRVSLNGSTLTMESGRILHMLVAKDISDIHLMAARIREAQEQLIHSGRLASLGEMAAGIGHELTQPLNAILLFARNSLKLLNQETLNKQQLEENLQLITDRVKKASFIIKSLKSFARKDEPETYPVDINRILSNVVTFMDAQMNLSDIDVEVQLDDTIPPTIAHDVRLEQIFLNIIQNAIQSMGTTESPKLTIKTFAAKSIDPESLLEKNYVVASIRDNGAGIHPDDLSRIFDPFFTTREVGLGMGLGLSIVDRIVRNFSGFIKVESSPGHGSCFFLHLPAYQERK